MHLWASTFALACRNVSAESHVEWSKRCFSLRRARQSALTAAVRLTERAAKGLARASPRMLAAQVGFSAEARWPISPGTFSRAHVCGTEPRNATHAFVSVCATACQKLGCICGQARLCWPAAM